MKSIEYRYGNDLELAGVIELYNASGLGERRPVDDPEIFADMLRHANLTVTAWDGEALVGISRTLTDFSYVGIYPIWRCGDHIRNSALESS